LAPLGYAYARAGRRDDARHVLDDLLSRRSQEYVAALGIADVFVGLDAVDDACAWLERACDERNGLVSAIANASRYDSLRGKPRFRALVRRMNLPEAP